MRGFWKSEKYETLVWSEGRAVPYSILKFLILTICKGLPFGSYGQILLEHGILTNFDVLFLSRGNFIQFD